jgi:biotin carboxyl carrier protein
MKRYSNGILLTVFYFLSASILLSSCTKTQDESSDEALGAPVSVSHPHIAPMTDYLRLNATTAFLTKEVVRSTVQGFVLKSFRNIGDTVKHGDILFTLQTKEASALTNAVHDSSRAQFSSVITIKAASNGILSEIDHFAGDFVAEGDQIAVVANSASLAVLLNAPYQDTPLIHIGASCGIQLPGGRTISGTIVKSVPSVDISSQTQTYVIHCNKQSLPENLNVVVNIAIRSVAQAVVVPGKAIMTNETQNEFWIMKLLNDSTAVKVNIRKGIENDSLVQIIQPELSLKEKIITEGAYGLADTARVAVQ